MTSPGDMSGDGRPGLIARNSSTGAVCLYKGTSTGKLSARVKFRNGNGSFGSRTKIATGWQAYKGRLLRS
ncbi:hypothetical protein [Streptomyces canus]|uniref:hypothetical protein n=1 Tax=Streptomyces canus TaxID=58343 RepID=UPI0003680CCC|nr:hypothetical protein [Streptomyces canus]